MEICQCLVELCQHEHQPDFIIIRSSFQRTHPDDLQKTTLQLVDISVS